MKVKSSFTFMALTVTAFSGMLTVNAQTTYNLPGKNAMPILNFKKYLL